MIQFNFTPLGDTLRFRYVFASEEYNEFVNTSFNDVFGFFLTGPNPLGGNYNNTNIAVVPGTTPPTPVGINFVNNGNAFGCTTGPCSNCSYYHDNCNGTNPLNCAFDGYTIPMTAYALVVPCSTYTIKLAVADIGDGSYNSAVFLEANSFQSTGFQLSVASNSTSSNDTVLYEGCGSATLVVERTNNFNQLVQVPINITGTATNGVDYQTIPDTLTFTPGMVTDTILIQPIFDMLAEADETITITVNSTQVCANSSSSITFLIKNYTPLSVNAGNDTTMTCVGGMLHALVTGGVPTVTYDWNNGQHTAANYPIMPTGPGWYFITVSDTCGASATDSVYVDYWAPEFIGFSMSAPQPTASPVEGCGSSDITIFRTENINLSRTYPISLSGTASYGVDYPNIPLAITFNAGDSSTVVNLAPIYDMVPEGTETVTIGVTDTLCDGTLVPFSQTVNIRNLNPVQVDAGPDLLMDCPHHALMIQPSYTDGWAPLTYSWNVGGTTPEVNAYPGDTTMYVITVTDSCGYTDADTMWVNVAHDPVAAFNFNDIIYCEPAFVTFDDVSTPTSGSSLTYNWTFGDGNSSTDTDPSHTFNQFGDYPVTLTVTNQYNCVNSVTHNVTVKPVPTPVPFFTPQNPSTLQPDVTFWDESYPDIVSWYWETGDGTTSTDSTFLHTYPQPGSFDALLAVVNQWGCTDTLQFTVTVVEETSIYIPNSFSPDGNGLNDIFKIYGTNWRTMEFRVFNRWGEEVFFSDNPDHGWNGAVNNQGEQVMAGTYVYSLYVIDFYGKEYNYRGHINILR